VWVLACILIVAGVATFSSSFSGVFIGDDLDAIVDNRNLRTFWPLGVTTTAPLDSTLAGRPVAALTFALNYAMAPAAVRDVMEPGPGAGPDHPFYTNVWGYHAVNLLIHLCAALALFGVVRRSLNVPVLRDRFAHLSSLLAFAIALIWIVHPLQAASVTFIVQRVESLMGCLLLTTLYCAIRAAESGFSDRKWIAAAVAACAIGMGVKEIMFAAPLIVAAWIYLFRPDVRLIDSPRVLLAALAATWIILGVLLSHDSRPKSVGFGVGGWTAMMYLRTQAEILVHYLRLVFWPHPLAFHYAWQPVESWIAVAAQVALLATLGIATLVAFVRRLPVAFPGVVFFVILAPTSSFLPIASEIAAEHRMYLPLAAVLTALVIGAVAVASRLRAAPPRWPSAAWAIVAAMAVALAWTTVSRNRLYASVDAMTEANSKSRPNDVSVQLVYGSQLSRNGRYVEAEAVLRRALQLPQPPGADTQIQLQAMMRFFLGSSLCSQTRFAECATEIERAIALKADLPNAHAFLAEALLNLGRAQDALNHLERAIVTDADPIVPLRRAAWVLATSSNAALRNGARAVQHAERALALGARPDVVSLSILAAAYAEHGDFDKALATIRQAIDLDAKLGGSQLTPTLAAHLALFQSKQPVRTVNW